MKISDISSWQGDINWDKARKELDLVIFRASVGDTKDKKYVEYATQCKIPFGVYHYFKAGTILSAIAETQFFYTCATQNNLKPLFFVMDIEYRTQVKNNTKKICEAILQTLKDLGVEKIGLYIGQEKYLYVKDIIDKFDFIWIPRYGKNDGTANPNYKPIYPCDLWQYTDKGTINGVPEKVDLNQLNGAKTLNWFVGKNKQETKYISINRILHKGDIGFDVRQLQMWLNELGYNCGKVDGDFGNKTYYALKKFQRDNHLVVDGIFGEKSLKKILAEIDAK